MDERKILGAHVGVGFMPAFKYRQKNSLMVFERGRKARGYELTLVWFLVTIATATLAFSAGQDASSYTRGEQVFNASCMECHDLRPIQMQALDMDGWTKIVRAMIEKGAKVKNDDVPGIVEYLATNYGPLPDGAGKQVVLNKCTSCHDLKRIKQHLASPEEWAETLNSMLNEGASFSDEEFVVLLTYLARNFRP